MVLVNNEDQTQKMQLLRPMTILLNTIMRIINPAITVMANGGVPIVLRTMGVLSLLS